jgi:class 3 adenylate cyclase/tetratricopeptide (TPR) repeat protein
MTVVCAACSTENEPGRKFCGECGAQLSRSCPSCATANPAGTKFCGECGVALTSAASPLPPPAAAHAERRLVSVLFADLVGFTTSSESRDAEDTRELLSRYFDTARTVIERYGGAVEKFIGDAVMAVWGAPIATEDDAERAVRAALDVVHAVPGLDASLEARAAVLTGEAAVTLGATDQGMVAGDLVNAASRVQSLAAPGSVLVGESTRRASDAAIVYEDAGQHELKGRSESVRLYRALRVVANRGGEGRSVGLEAPFVGRDRELRLVKETFHATAGDGRAHLLSVVGVAGIGKSRLSWEFEKYIDGLTASAWWHRGRCLAYGEGIAYWALAEMVRMRVSATEDEPADKVAERLHEALPQYVPDEDDRAFVEPRLQQLLGVTDRVATDKQDLFSGWRLFLERMAEQNPVVLVVEDIQWADASMIEFLHHLMEWSRSSAIFVLTLARPEVSERHPTWGAGLRTLTSLQLDPLPDDAIDTLLRGLVPGLPEDAVARIRERSEGIPLYAVETVRGLLDRGLLEPGDDGYVVVGDLSALDVPETLHALIASRLDGLSAAERSIVQDAAVLGKTFAPHGVAVLSGRPREEVEQYLDSLVRKEVLALDTDPRSPERGQYGFLQALVQRVAYETLSRADRKARHVAAARYLAEEAGIDPDEIAEVIGQHLLDALDAGAADDDAPALRREAREWLDRAGERATARAASEEAMRIFESAAGLADDPAVEAGLLERAGAMARRAARFPDCERLQARARALYTEIGDTHGAARSAATLALALSVMGRNEEGIAVAEEAYAVLASDEPDADVATLAAELARAHWFAGNPELAQERVEAALDIAERLQLPAVIASALNTKALIVGRRHSVEGYALVKGALEVATMHELVHEALRSYNNLIVALDKLDRLDETLPLVEEALALAVRHGDRDWQERLAVGLAGEYQVAGRWDDAIALYRELDQDHRGVWLMYPGLIEMLWLRGDDAGAREALEGFNRFHADESNYQGQQMALDRQARRAWLSGDADAMLSAAAGYVHIATREREADTTIAEGVRTALHAVRDARDTATARTILEATLEAREAHTTRALTAQTERLAGVLAMLDGRCDEAIGHFAVALAASRSYGDPLWIAEVLVDYADALVREARADEAFSLVSEARELLEHLGAARLLPAVEALERAVPEAATAS